MIAWLKKLFGRWQRSLLEPEVVHRYLKLGEAYGDAVSYLMMGAIINPKLARDFAEAERRYRALGYAPIPMKAFVEASGYGKPIPPELIRRQMGALSLAPAEGGEVSEP